MLQPPSMSPERWDNEEKIQRRIREDFEKEWKAHHQPHSEFGLDAMGARKAGSSASPRSCHKIPAHHHQDPLAAHEALQQEILATARREMYTFTTTKGPSIINNWIQEQPRLNSLQIPVLKITFVVLDLENDVSLDHPIPQLAYKRTVDGADKSPKNHNVGLRESVGSPESPQQAVKKHWKGLKKLSTPAGERFLAANIPKGSYDGLLTCCKVQGAAVLRLSDVPQQVSDTCKIMDIETHFVAWCVLLEQTEGYQIVSESFVVPKIDENDKCEGTTIVDPEAATRAMKEQAARRLRAMAGVQSNAERPPWVGVDNGSSSPFRQQHRTTGGLQLGTSAEHPEERQGEENPTDAVHAFVRSVRFSSELDGIFAREREVEQRQGRQHEGAGEVDNNFRNALRSDEDSSASSPSPSSRSPKRYNKLSSSNSPSPKTPRQQAIVRIQKKHNGRELHDQTAHGEAAQSGEEGENATDEWMQGWDRENQALQATIAVRDTLASEATITSTRPLHPSEALLQEDRTRSSQEFVAGVVIPRDSRSSRARRLAQGSGGSVEDLEEMWQFREDDRVAKREYQMHREAQKHSTVDAEPLIVGAATAIAPLPNAPTTTARGEEEEKEDEEEEGVYDADDNADNLFVLNPKQRHFVKQHFDVAVIEKTRDRVVRSGSVEAASSPQEHTPSTTRFLQFEEELQQMKTKSRSTKSVGGRDHLPPSFDRMSLERCMQLYEQQKQIEAEQRKVSKRLGEAVKDIDMDLLKMHQHQQVDKCAAQLEHDLRQMQVVEEELGKLEKVLDVLEGKWRRVAIPKNEMLETTVKIDRSLENLNDRATVLKEKLHFGGTYK